MHRLSTLQKQDVRSMDIGVLVFDLAIFLTQINCSAREWTEQKGIVILASYLLSFRLPQQSLLSSPSLTTPIGPCIKSLQRPCKEPPKAYH